ncbi:MAG: cyanophycinase [Bacteroidales bacterium]
MQKTILAFTIFLLLGISCQTSTNSDSEKTIKQPEGKLFIIGGGKKPAAMLQDLAEISGINEEGYTVVLPMSSSSPDSSGMWIKEDLKKVGVSNIHTFNLQTEDEMTTEKLDSVKNAGMIYLTGGSQKRFMEIAHNTPLTEAIQHAYKSGATIAGTSAGAAVMSKKMITGDELKHSEYTGNFRTIEANNIVIEPGLGLLDNVIVDQHFIERMRMNRLIAAVLENPEQLGIGIDESTAILVKDKEAEVYGVGQVLVLKNTEKESKVKDGLLGGKNMEMSIYLPGESFKIK